MEEVIVDDQNFTISIRSVSDKYYVVKAFCTQYYDGQPFSVSLSSDEHYVKSDALQLVRMLKMNLWTKYYDL